MLSSVSVLFSSDEDCETFNAFYFTTLSARQSSLAYVTRVPGCPAHLSFSNAVNWDFCHHHRCFTNQAVDVVSAFSLRQLEKPFAKQPKGDNLGYTKQNNLKPDRARYVQTGKGT